MTIRFAPASTKVGDVVRVHGALHQIMEANANGNRSYVRLADGKEFVVPRDVQRQLELSGDLTSDTNFAALEADLRDVLTADWGSFTEGEKASAERKKLYMDALDELDVDLRRQEKHALPVIKAVHETQDKSGKKCPSLRTVSRWSYRWIASGRDMRALADMNYRKGNRRDDDPYSWSDRIVLECIEKLMMQAPYCSAAHTARVADALVHTKSIEEGLPLRPRLKGDERHIGAHRVYDLLEKFGYYERLTNQFGRKQARYLSQTAAPGPQGDYALHEVEVDHTKLDIMVYDKNREERGRPWLTVLIDRYSRMIVGFYISFEAPSWFSVMMALRMAVMPKQKYLASLNYDFEFDWDCYGTPDKLFMDRGAEFRSESLRATAMVLRIKLHDLPRASGQLKGKVERWFGVENQGLLHSLPGYVGSNPTKRIEENAVAKLTIDQVETLVAAFIVDVYNNRPHGKTKERPSKRYAESMENMMNNKLPPPEELLGPATNPTRTARVGKNGLRFDNMVFQSDELRSLYRRRNCTAMLSIVRYDPRDMSTVLVYDGVHKPWVKAHLVGPYGGKKLSYEEVQYRIRTEEPAPESDEIALKRSRAILKLENRKDEYSPRARKPRKLQDPRKRGEFTSQATYDGAKSEGGLTGFSPKNPPSAVRNDSRGPFATPSAVQEFLEAERVAALAQDVPPRLAAPKVELRPTQATEHIPERDASPAPRVDKIGTPPAPRGTVADEAVLVSHLVNEPPTIVPEPPAAEPSAAEPSPSLRGSLPPSLEPTPTPTSGGRRSNPGTIRR